MEEMPPLADAEIARALAALPGWAREGDEIVKTFECASFPAAISFVVQVGFLAEKADHHPDLDIRWRKVKVALSTHSAGGLTNLDFDLAGEIEALGA
jgi:4a-hydroxytetrahydrobiopterin dehydratase